MWKHKFKKSCISWLSTSCNNLLKKKNGKCELYPLEVNYCDKCYNCQLSISVDPKKMFSNYLYTSSTSKIFRNHFVDASKVY